MIVPRRGRALRDESGQLFVWLAFLLPVIILLSAFVIEIGNWFEHKRHLQLQADAAALAGGAYFSACVGDTAVASGLIVGEANKYVGNPGGSSAFNQFVGTNQGSFTALFDKKQFAASSPPPDDTVEVPTEAQDICHAKMLDVKLTEANLPVFFGLLPFPFVPAINARARVEVESVRLEDDVRPIAVRDDSEYKCAQAILINKTTGAVVSTIDLPSRTQPADFSYTQFQNPGGTAVTMPSAAWDHLYVQIRAGDGSGANCGNSETFPEDDNGNPVGGVNFINVYTTAGSGNDPAIHAVTLSSSDPGCAPDAYFFTTGCAVTVQAAVEFASGVPAADRIVRINGQPATPSGGLWFATFSVSAQAGPQPYSVTAEQQSGSTSKGTCTNKNNNPCKFDFKQQQQAYAATDDDSQPSSSGGLQLVEIGEVGQSVVGANTFVKSTTHTLLITARFGGLANANPGDPPIFLRNGVQTSKRTGAIDCGQGNAGGKALENAVRDGCPSGVYLWNPGDACVVPTADPINCVQPVPGNKVGTAVVDGLKARIGSSCNNWNAWRDNRTAIPPGDPRAITVIITSPANLSGNQNGPPIPVLKLATFYVTGLDNQTGNGLGCNNDPYPPNGSSNPAVQKASVWGHWIKYVLPSGVGEGSGDPCQFDAFGNCITVLTR
jgi:hypothetical protein